MKAPEMQDDSNRLEKSASIAPDDIRQATVSALKNGDYDAFDTIFLRYYGPIRAFITSMTHSEESGEELAQQVFVNLWENREKLDPTSNIKGYIYRIAKNGALNYFKSVKVRQTYSHSVSPEDEVDEVSSDDLMMAEEIKLLVDLAVNRMPKQRKKIFQLSRYEGLSNDEIARELNITKNAVERHLTFALKNIREILSSATVFLF